MRPVIVTTSGVSASSPVVLDYFQNPFTVGIQCVVSGGATYTVQATEDDPFQSGGLGSATWFSVESANLVGATTSQIGRTEILCRAIRVNQTVGAGSVTMTVVQAGAGKG